jgi:transposase-like protein
VEWQHVVVLFSGSISDDDASSAHLEAVRWPHGPVCLLCGSFGNAHFVGRAHCRRCNGCQTKFKVRHGTPFEGTHLPVWTWFTALYLVAAASSVKLADHLGIGQKTA